MRTRIYRTFTIICLITLIAAAFAIAESEQDARRPDSRRARYGQGEGFRGSRGGQMDRPGYGRGMGMGQDMLPEMIKRKLNLTEEQTEKLEAAQIENRKATLELTKQHQQLREKLEAAVEKGDKDTITKIAQDIGKNIGQTALLKVSAQDTLKEILTEDQLKVLDEFKKQRDEMREKMRQRMQRSGRGDRSRGGRGQRSQNQDSTRRRRGRQNQ